MPRTCGARNDTLNLMTLAAIPPRYINNGTPRWGVPLFGAADRNRTGTDFTPRDFKSLVSTYSTTAAYLIIMDLRPMCRCPVAVPDIFLAVGAATSSADHGTHCACPSSATGSGQARGHSGVYSAYRHADIKSACRYLSTFLRVRQVRRRHTLPLSRIKIGNISKRPASISTINTIFVSGLNNA